MTFQVALVGIDGLVVASDRRMVHVSPEIDDDESFQTYEGEKFYRSADDRLVCFYAGRETSANAARKIAIECEPRTGQPYADCEEELYRCARSVGAPLALPSDKLFVVRKDVSNSVWVIFRSPASVSPPRRISDRLCIGDNSPARFLPWHLWKPNSTVSRLKRLAVLTLAYAAEENPTGVGNRFDVLALDRSGNFSWSNETTDDPYVVMFRRRLHEMFGEESGDR